MLSDIEYRAVVDFVYREARLADEARYAEWLALWTDDGGRLETRIKLLQTGHRYSQEPASRMRRLVSNIEAAPADNGELVVESNFALAELAIQAKREMHWWVGRTTHRLRVSAASSGCAGRRSCW